MTIIELHPNSGRGLAVVMSVRGRHEGVVVGANVLVSVLRGRVKEWAYLGLVMTLQKVMGMMRVWVVEDLIGIVLRVWIIQDIMVGMVVGLKTRVVSGEGVIRGDLLGFMRVVCEAGFALIAVRVREAKGVEVGVGFALKVVNGLRRVAVEQSLIAGGLVHYAVACGVVAMREAGLVLGLRRIVGLLTFGLQVGVLTLVKVLALGGVEWVLVGEKRI